MIKSRIINLGMSEFEIEIVRLGDSKDVGQSAFIYPPCRRFRSRLFRSMCVFLLAETYRG